MWTKSPRRCSHCRTTGWHGTPGRQMAWVGRRRGGLPIKRRHNDQSRLMSFRLCVPWRSVPGFGRYVVTTLSRADEQVPSRSFLVLAHTYFKQDQTSDTTSDLEHDRARTEETAMNTSF